MDAVLVDAAILMMQPRVNRKSFNHYNKMTLTLIQLIYDLNSKCYGSLFNIQLFIKEL